jgi:NTP pyrophosphatase (non-canonical NTP hydrolase)
MKNYVELAIRTEAPSEHRLLHAAMGFCTEVAEVEEWFLLEVQDKDHLREELGDIMWYVAIALDKLDLELEIPEALIYGFDIALLNVSVGRFMDQIKREFFYAKAIDETVLIEALGQIVEQVISINAIVLKEPFDLALEKNIDKLKARFPDKFTNEAAIHRDLDKEKVALS